MALILTVIIGMLSGIIFGMIPGAAAFVAVAVAYPILATLDPILVMAYYVSVLISVNYANSVTAILYGIPGDATAIPTAREGHRYFRKGYGHLAVSSNAISSTIGVFISVFLFIAIIPNIVDVFKFYNSVLQTIIITCAIAIITLYNKQNKFLTLTLFVFGGILGHIGINPITFDSWGTFDNYYLSLGIPFTAVMIGVYLFPEILKMHNAEISKPKTITKTSVGKGILFPSILGSIVGFWCGLIPGITNILGSYASAAIVKKYFRLPNLKSISAAEAANNSGALSSLLPLIILAIPITGSEVLVYYLMMEKGFVFSTDSLWLLYPILYTIPFVSICSLIISWFGFNILGSVVYYYKKHKTIANIVIIANITLVSAFMYPFVAWFIICVAILMTIGYTIRKFDTSPILYGFFLSDLFYDNIHRTIIIMFS